MEIAAEAQLGMEAKEGVLPPGWFLGRGDGGLLGSGGRSVSRTTHQAPQTSMTGVYWGSGTVSWLC